MDELLQAFTNQTIEMAPKVVTALVVLLGFWIGGSLTKRIIIGVGDRASDNKRYVFHLIGQTIKAVLIIVGIISALGTLGINVTAMVAGLGLTGFALGFALKDALSNLLAGVLVLIYQPFCLGDTIGIKGFEGKVIQIDLRYTTLKTETGKILVPNSELFTNSIKVTEAAPDSCEPIQQSTD